MAMTVKEMRLLPDIDLIAASMQKGKKGNYTREANNAMKIRLERNCHWHELDELLFPQDRSTGGLDYVY